MTFSPVTTEPAQATNRRCDCGMNRRAELPHLLSGEVFPSDANSPDAIVAVVVQLDSKRLCAWELPSPSEVLEHPLPGEKLGLSLMAVILIRTVVGDVHHRPRPHHVGHLFTRLADA